MRHPPIPPADHGFLLPRIIARDHLRLPCYHATLCADHPGCQLQSVCPCGQTTTSPGSTPDTLCLHIPLTLHLRDACGHARTASTTLDVETCMPHCMHHTPCHLTWVAPDVRLLECACPDGCCFHAKLSICADIFLLRMEPCLSRPPKPPCPQLPLYPPPMR